MKRLTSRKKSLVMPRKRSAHFVAPAILALAGACFIPGEKPGADDAGSESDAGSGNGGGSDDGAESGNDARSESDAGSHSDAGSEADPGSQGDADATSENDTDADGTNVSTTVASSETSTSDGSTQATDPGTTTTASGVDSSSTDDTTASPTQGCGAAPPSSGRFSIDVGGATREYILTLPEDYDPNHPYRLVFGWHPLGGSADQVATGFGGGYYGLLDLAEGSTVFVSPEGIDQGWANPGGRDTDFLRAMLDRFRGELCIDETRIFSTGFSYGGMMSFAIACEMGDVFRAIAPMSGALYSGCEDNDHPIAMMGWHGDNDTVVPLGDGETARDVLLENSHCLTTSTPVDPAPCVAYEGCDAEHPIIWCEFSGGHTPAPNSAGPIWEFFTRF